MADAREMHLYSKDTGTVGETTRLFGEEKGLLVCRPARFLWTPWFSIPEGCYALVERFGQLIDHPSGSPVWPAGFHFGMFWTKVTALVSKQSVVFNMPVKGCKTQDNVTVQINLSIVFRVMGDAECARAERPLRARKAPNGGADASPRARPLLSLRPRARAIAARARTRTSYATSCTR